MIVFSNPLPGREAEFDDWYTHVHMRDVLRGCPGAIHVQRFRAAADQAVGSPRYGFLAVYVGDHHGFTTGHRELIFGNEMPISAAFDVPDHRAAYYDIVCGSDPAESAGDDLLVERAAARGELGDVEARLRAPGVRSGLLARVAGHQLFPQHEDTAAVGLYRLADPATALLDWPTLGRGVELARYTPLTPRVTAEEVRHSSAAQARRSAEVRVSMDRLTKVPGP
jgi:hypothetical protein